MAWILEKLNALLDVLVELFEDDNDHGGGGPYAMA